MTETEISSRFTTALRLCGCIVFKVHGHGMQQPGWPDFYLATEGFNGWIETKGRDTKLELKQKTIITRLRKVGVPVYILRFITEQRTYHFQLEDENGQKLREFRFDQWKDGAEQFLLTLQEERECGIRAS